MRLDLYLVEKKMASSRTQAQDFIASGYVALLVDEKPKFLDKASYLVSDKDKIVVIKNDLQKYVSRAGLKLEGALNHLNLSVRDKLILDVGQSTGGFTDCLLRAGASRVVGVDVGHGQLHESLKQNPKVQWFESLNVKELSLNASFIKAIPDNNFDLIVGDVSFISLTKVFPAIVNFLAPGREYLFLVKPQFECGKEHLDKNGIVADERIYGEVEKTVRESAMQYFKNVSAYFPSVILGKDGNKEFFIYGRKN